MSEVQKLQTALIEQLKTGGHIRSASIAAAFDAVPRHLFLPGIALERVYTDNAIVTKEINGMAVSSSSQPAAMAIMLEQLRLEPGQRVLEIGAGTGYNAALMAHLVGPAGHVVTIDIDEDLVTAARQHLSAAGLERVQVICADGGLGYPDAAPYDRIILTVGAWDIAPAWHKQLRVGGLFLLPLAIRGIQRTVAFQNRGDYLDSTSVRGCSFIMLRGAFAVPQNVVPVGPEPGLSIFTEHGDALDAEMIYTLLSHPGKALETTIQATGDELWRSLAPWLALHESGYGNMVASEEFVTHNTLPDLFDNADSDQPCFLHAFLSENSVCVLSMRSSDNRSATPANASVPRKLIVKMFGMDETLAYHLLEQITAWDKRGRPSSDQLHIKAFPIGIDYAPAANEMVVSKPWTRLVLNWDSTDKAHG